MSSEEEKETDGNGNVGTFACCENRFEVLAEPEDNDPPVERCETHKYTVIRADKQRFEQKLDQLTHNVSLLPSCVECKDGDDTQWQPFSVAQTVRGALASIVWPHDLVTLLLDYLGAIAVIRYIFQRSDDLVPEIWSGRLTAATRWRWLNDVLNPETIAIPQSNKLIYRGEKLVRGFGSMNNNVIRLLYTTGYMAGNPANTIQLINDFDYVTKVAQPLHIMAWSQQKSFPVPCGQATAILTSARWTTDSTVTVHFSVYPPHMGPKALAAWSVCSVASAYHSGEPCLYLLTKTEFSRCRLESKFWEDKPTLPGTPHSLTILLSYPALPLETRCLFAIRMAQPDLPVTIRATRKDTRRNCREFKTVVPNCVQVYQYQFDRRRWKLHQTLDRWQTVSAACVHEDSLLLFGCVAVGAAADSLFGSLLQYFPGDQRLVELTTNCPVARSAAVFLQNSCPPCPQPHPLMMA